MVVKVRGEVVPVANGEPPDDTLYHRTLLALLPGVAVRVPFAQIDALLAVGAPGMALTVTDKVEIVVVLFLNVTVPLPAVGQVIVAVYCVPLLEVLFTVPLVAVQLGTGYTTPLSSV